MSIVGLGLGTIGIMGLMVRMLACRPWGNRLNETTRRIDAIGRDIAELRDRTGTLEETLSTFMTAGKSPNAA